MLAASLYSPCMKNFGWYSFFQTESYIYAAKVTNNASDEILCLVMQGFKRAILICLKNNTLILRISFAVCRTSRTSISSIPTVCTLFEFNSPCIALLCMYKISFKNSTLKVFIYMAINLYVHVHIAYTCDSKYPKRKNSLIESTFYRICKKYIAGLNVC